jgi:hypothetical protein
MRRRSGVSALACSNNFSCRLRHWLRASAIWDRLCSATRFIHGRDTDGLLTSESQGLGVTETVTPVLSQGWGPDAAIEASLVGVLTNALGARTTNTLFGREHPGLRRREPGRWLQAHVLQSPCVCTSGAAMQSINANVGQRLARCGSVRQYLARREMPGTS